MERIVRVGLIGYGLAGRVFHAPVIAAVPHMQLTKVVERNRDTADKTYPWVEIVRNAAELNDDSIDLVVVATPSSDHYEIAKAALLAGKHVVVEKPFTPTTDEADELIQLAQERGLVLSVYQSRRWDGDFKTVCRIVQEGLLGRLVDCDFHWDGYQPLVLLEKWRESRSPASGIFYDQGVHFLDQVLCLFGTPETVYADVYATREGSVADDYFDVRFTYGNGLKVSLKCSKLAREKAPRYILHGTEGSFVKYGMDPQEDALKNGYTPLFAANWGVESKEMWGTMNTTVRGLHVVGQIETIPGDYRGYYQNICNVITQGQELIVKPEQARNAIRLIELAYESSREQRPVRITGMK